GGETSEQDLFHSRLDQIIEMKHALMKLARTVDWGFLEQTFGAVYTDKPGQPPLPTRLMAGLAILIPEICRSMSRMTRQATPTTFPTRLCAIAGWRIRTSSPSAARRFSNMRWCSTVRR